MRKIIKLRNKVLCILGLNLLSVACTDSNDSTAEPIRIENAYVRALPASAQNTSAYFTISNLSVEDLVLTGAASGIATSVMIHETTNEKGMMVMNHVMSATIPAHGELVLESGGLHLMLMGLTRVPSRGDSVDITLQFQNGFEQNVKFPVRSVLDE